jgi:hypothetical protein
MFVTILAYEVGDHMGFLGKGETLLDLVHREYGLPFTHDPRGQGSCFFG